MRPANKACKGFSSLQMGSWESSQIPVGRSCSKKRDESKNEDEELTIKDIHLAL